MAKISNSRHNRGQGCSQSRCGSYKGHREGVEYSEGKNTQIYLFKLSGVEDVIELCLNNTSVSLVIDSRAYYNTLSVKDFT